MLSSKTPAAVYLADKPGACALSATMPNNQSASKQEVPGSNLFGLPGALCHRPSHTRHYGSHAHLLAPQRQGDARM